MSCNHDARDTNGTTRQGAHDPCALPGTPLFIFGSPRSGTTYLTEVLNRHPRVVLTNELRLMDFFRAVLQGPARDRALLYNDEHRAPFLRAFKVGLRQTAARYYADLVRRKLGPAAAPGDGPIVWGDKTPGYADPLWSPGCLALIDELFSEARFVHITREPRAVVGSMATKGWHSVVGALDLWARVVREGRAFAQKVGPERCVEITHERLCDDGHATLWLVLGLLGLPPSDELTAFLDAQQRQRTPFADPVTFGAAAMESGLGPEDRAFLDEVLETDDADAGTQADRVADWWSRRAAGVGAGGGEPAEWTPIPRWAAVGDLGVRMEAVRWWIDGARVSGEGSSVTTDGARVRASVRLRSGAARSGVLVSHTIYDGRGAAVFASDRERAGLGLIDVPEGESECDIEFRWPRLAPGVYWLTVGLTARDGSADRSVWAERIAGFRVPGPPDAPGAGSGVVVTARGAEAPTAGVG